MKSNFLLTHSNDFPKTKKILKKDDFRFKGKVLNSSLCKFVFQENNHTVSRLVNCDEKTPKSAVKRNRVKRIIREIFRQSSVLREKNLDIVAIVSRNNNLSSGLELNKLITSNWKKFEENL